jgi:hypothetical protein
MKSYVRNCNYRICYQSNFLCAAHIMVLSIHRCRWVERTLSSAGVGMQYMHTPQIWIPDAKVNFMNSAAEQKMVTENYYINRNCKLSCAAGQTKMCVMPIKFDY